MQCMRMQIESLVDAAWAVKAETCRLVSEATEAGSSAAVRAASLVLGDASGVVEAGASGCSTLYNTQRDGDAPANTTGAAEGAELLRDPNSGCSPIMKRSFCCMCRHCNRCTSALAEPLRLVGDLLTVARVLRLSDRSLGHGSSPRGDDLESQQRRLRQTSDAAASARSSPSRYIALSGQVHRALCQAVCLQT